MIIDKKCTCGSKSTGDTTIRCCNLCGLPMPNEPWHFNLDENIFSQVEKPVMPNEVLAGGLTKELFKILQWVYDQEEIELLETGWYCKGDELSTQEVLVKYFASQREA